MGKHSKNPTHESHPRYTAGTPYDEPTGEMKKPAHSAPKHAKPEEDRPKLKLNNLLTGDEVKNGGISEQELEYRVLERALGPTLAGQMTRDPDTLERVKNDPDYYDTLIEMANAGVGQQYEKDSEHQSRVRHLFGLSDWEEMDSRERGAQVLLRMTGDVIAPNDEYDDSDEDLDEEPGSLVRRMARKAVGLTGYYALQRGITKLYGWHFDRHKAEREKYSNMTEEQKRAYKEKVGKWSTRLVGVIGAAAVTGMAVRFGVDYWGNSSGGVALMKDEDKLPQEEPPVGPVDAEPGIPGHQDMSNADIRAFFDSAPDPALSPDKQYPNDFNGPLPIPDVNSEESLTTFKDALFEQLQGNPRELADYLGKMNIEGAPHPADFPSKQAYYDAVNAYGDELLRNPQLHMDQFEAMAEKMDGAIKYEVIPIDMAYESPYIMNGVVGQDDYVDHGGTVTRITFEDGTVIDVRNDCGQIIRLLKKPPVPVYVEEPTYVTPRQKYIPDEPEQSTYTPPPQRQVPPPQSPPPVNPPPVNPPPVNPPPVSSGKNPSDSSLLNPNFNPDLQRGADRMPRGSLQPEPAAPPPVYRAPAPSFNPGDLAPGASPVPSGGFDGPPAQSGTNGPSGTNTSIGE